MRELLALQLKGALAAQQNPVQINLLGEKHDVLEFRHPEMTAALADEMIQAFQTRDRNFWNSMRLMQFTRVLLVGDKYRKTLSSKDFILHSKDYDRYRREFAKEMAGLAAGAKQEIKQK